MSQTSSYSANTEGVSLSACTKCNNRYPSDELSQGQQICKGCRGSLQSTKCNYCRTEFHQETVPLTNGNNSSNNRHQNSICNKCQLLEGQHGKPGPCAYCNIIAAFIGTKCQRCTNSEKKYGPPLACDHCKQKCAFDREKPESKKKVDNKLLCWLCTMAYKRTLARAKQKEASKSATHSDHRSSERHRTSSSSNHHHRSSSHRHTSSDGVHNNNTNGSLDSSYQRSSHNHNHRHTSNNSRQRESSSSTNKKQRLDPSSNNMQPSSAQAHSSLSDNRFAELTGSGDMTSVITQLKDQVASLTKRIQVKDRELLSKDQQIAELRATITREQREAREKLNTIQKQHAERMSELQAKVIAMQKQMISQNKAARATSLVEPPLVI